jgi:hypothetical protein
VRIPKSEVEKERFVRTIIDACTASQQERRSLYDKRRNYFLYGQNTQQKVKYNALKSHMKLVASFLFSAEGLTYNITPPKNADEKQVQKFLALQDAWNEDVHDSGIADTFADGVLWALNFDTMIGKMGWNDITKQCTLGLIEPQNFGVYREDESDFTSQPAMNHSFLLDYDAACEHLDRAGKAGMINSLQIEGLAAESGLPSNLQALIITATGGENLGGNIAGSVNPSYEEGARFTPKVTAPMVRFHETWVWDTEAKDYRSFHSLGGGILLSDSKDTIDALKKAEKLTIEFDSSTNLFLAGENPFVPITPFKLYNYFWGDAHMEDIIPLQKWSTLRLEQINELLEKNVDPGKVFSGFQGIPDEKAEALGGPGTWVLESMPGAKVEELKPTMPEDLFREFNEIGTLMIQASGLTEVVAGKSSGGARGGVQQRQLQITGGGQIRKVAVSLETPLVRIGDLGVKLKMKNDTTKISLDDGQEILADQIDGDFSIRVAGHSHSPLFTLETKELATLLFKAQAIDQEWLVRMLNPPEQSNILHSLRSRQKKDAEQKQQEALLHAQHPEKKKK